MLSGFQGTNHWNLRFVYKMYICCKMFIWVSRYLMVSRYLLVILFIQSNGIWGWWSWEKNLWFFMNICKSQAFLLWPGGYQAFDLIHIHFLANWRLCGACTNQHWGINQGVWSHEVDVNRWATKTAETVVYSGNTLQGCLQIYNNILF